MNNIFKKVLSSAEEFANGSNRVSLLAVSVLDRIVPQGIARANCVQWRDAYMSCGSCVRYGSAWRMKWRQYRVCDLPPGQICATTTHCGPWQFHHSIACCMCPDVGNYCEYY